MNPTTKRFRIQTNVGKCRHTVSYHDGVKTHQDGSAFFDIATFGRKRDRDEFVRNLKSQGYTPA